MDQDMSFDRLHENLKIFDVIFENTPAKPYNSNNISLQFSVDVRRFYVRITNDEA